MAWERALDMIVAVCIATLIYFLVELLEAVEAIALWGTEVSHSTSMVCESTKGDQMPGYLEETCNQRSLK